MTMKSQFLAMAMMAGMMENATFPVTTKNKERKFIPLGTKNLKQQKGTFHYWFRSDGTFLNENQDERMRKDECVFTCFAMNNKNAIKKFNAFIRSNEAE